MIIAVYFLASTPQGSLLSIKKILKIFTKFDYKIILNLVSKCKYTVKIFHYVIMQNVYTFLDSLF